MLHEAGGAVMNCPNCKSEMDYMGDAVNHCPSCGVLHDSERGEAWQTRTPKLVEAARGATELLRDIGACGFVPDQKLYRVLYVELRDACGMKPEERS